MPNDRILTIPNILTLFRLFLLVPIVMRLMAGDREQAFILMAIALATDLMDGYIARKFDQRSDLGQMMDPVVDKLSIMSVIAVLVFSQYYLFPKWFFVFIVIREILVLFFGHLVIRKYSVVLPSRWPGKISAFCVGISVPLFIFEWVPYAFYMIYIAAVLTLYSSIFYLRVFLRNYTLGPEN